MMRNRESGGNTKRRRVSRTRSQIILSLVDRLYRRLNIPSNARVRFPSLFHKYQLTAFLRVMKKLVRFRRSQSPIPRIVNRSNLPSPESLRHKHQLTGTTKYNKQLSWRPARLRLTLIRYHRVRQSHWSSTRTIKHKNLTSLKLSLKFNYR